MSRGSLNVCVSLCMCVSLSVCVITLGLFVCESVLCVWVDIEHVCVCVCVCVYVCIYIYTIPFVLQVYGK